MIINLFEKIIIIFLLCLALAALIIWGQIYLRPAGQENLNVSRPMAIIGEAKIKLEIADTPSKRYQGLSRRASLCPDCGLLFVWPRPAKRAFVMREMNFPLDIIWIAGGKIIKIDANLPPEGKRPQKIYASGQAVDYVLEVNGGFCQRQQIKVGDRVKILR